MNAPFTLTQYLVKEKILTSDQILSYCAKTFNLPVFNKPVEQVDDHILNVELICRYRLIPINHDKYHLQLAVTNPIDHENISLVSFHTGLRPNLFLISEDDLQKTIEFYCKPRLLNVQLSTTLSKIDKSLTLINEEIFAEKAEPVIEFVDHLLKDAIHQQISDIHIEPYENECRIRFRRDGLLLERAQIPLHLTDRLITRLKIMSQLNIAERRLPQDGRLEFNHSPKMDIRINTCPTLFGEKIVLRLLRQTHVTIDIRVLGLTNCQEQLFLKHLNQPQGLILVTGPTGSGKTITLYSALKYLNQIEKNISTVEDPVEIQLPGINQVSVNRAVGLEFPNILRTLLRQDPDIIMIGEIRDEETATIAIQASQTGHLVIATLHTNNASQTIERLRSLNIPPYAIHHSLSLIIAQRLIRKLCHHCKIKSAANDDQIFTAHRVEDNADNSHDPLSYFEVQGCEKCHTGYQGRTGIFELMPISTVTLTNAPLSPLLNQSTNHCTLWQAGLTKVKEGITSIAEIQRVLGNPL